MNPNPSGKSFYLTILSNTNSDKTEKNVNRRHWLESRHLTWLVSFLDNTEVSLCRSEFSINNYNWPWVRGLRQRSLLGTIWRDHGKNKCLGRLLPRWLFTWLRHSDDSGLIWGVTRDVLRVIAAEYLAISELIASRVFCSGLKKMT